MRKNAVFDVQFSTSEFSLLEKCVAFRVPLFVCELDDQGWFLCPNCHSAFEYEYVEHCSCCGQSLTWYGTMSHAHKVGSVEPQKKKKISAEQKEDKLMRQLEKRANAVEAEIGILKEQMKEKKRELQALKESEEDHKRKRLMKAIARSGKSIDEIIETLEA